MRRRALLLAALLWAAGCSDSPTDPPLPHLQPLDGRLAVEALRQPDGSTRFRVYASGELETEVLVTPSGAARIRTFGERERFLQVRGRAESGPSMYYGAGSCSQCSGEQATLAWASAEMAAAFVAYAASCAFAATPPGAAACVAATTYLTIAYGKWVYALDAYDRCVERWCRNPTLPHDPYSPQGPFW